MNFNSEKPMWLSSIYVQIDNPNIESYLVSLSKELECDLLTGDTSDLIAIPSFATVVDRSVVGRKWWQEYIEYRILTKDRTPCIVIDSHGQQFGNKLKRVYYTDDPSMLGKIISKEKKRLTRFKFYYANSYIQRAKMEISTFWADFR